MWIASVSAQVVAAEWRTMSTKNAASEHIPRIADRLASARRGHFVGRQAELDLFRAALLSAEPPFAVLHIYGSGGVGKTTLLHEYVRVAAESGRPVVRLDGRDVDPSPQRFLRALGRVIGLQGDDLSSTVRDWPPTGILLIDTYETLIPLDAWLRETFLPQLPAQSLVVIAGRNPPAPAWRTDIDWASLTRITALRNLSPDESQAYLAAHGIPDNQHADVLAFTHGHPLALALVADVLRQGDRLASFDPGSEPNVVRVLLERLVQDVPSAEHRLALEVCVLAWATTEAMLADVLDRADAHVLFDWLRRLSFIEHGPYGLFPHDLAREVLAADLRWRNPDGHQRLTQRLAAHLHSRLERARGIEQQRVWFDLLSLTRHHPFFQSYFEWAALGSAYAEPASPEDHAPILAMVQQHEGSVSAQIAHHWLRRQPEAFLVFRTFGGELLGFMAQLTLHLATPADSAVDPAVPAALQFMQHHGSLRPGEELVHLRFWMSRDAYQNVSPAINLAAINSSIYWTTHPRLAWNFIVAADPIFHEPHFTSIHMWRAPEADFEVDGRRYSIFAHDWRVEPVAAWLNIKTELAALTTPDLSRQQTTPAPPLVVLAQAEFAEAARQALRDYTHSDRLAANPLMRTRLIPDAINQPATPARLQALLREAVAGLLANPKDLKFHRAIWHTYVEPAPTQEQAAELLGLPFNTYRYHLAQGIERIADWLWQRELSGADR
jgi:hypothetical protein